MFKVSTSKRFFKYIFCIHTKVGTVSSVVFGYFVGNCDVFFLLLFISLKSNKKQNKKHTKSFHVFYKIKIPEIQHESEKKWHSYQLGVVSCFDCQNPKPPECALQTWAVKHQQKVFQHEGNGSGENSETSNKCCK